ncbi:MAG: response regulator transcription factor [Cyanobacteria bacterium P01_G01_bin.67]
MTRQLNTLPNINQNNFFATRTKIPCIFLIAKKQLLIDFIEIELRHCGYTVEVFKEAAAATIAIRQDEPDLIILDWSISFLSSLDIYHCLRSTNNYIPILALTDTTSVQERISILNSGADDCFSYPFAIAELLAIVRARLRQQKSEKTPTLIFEDLQLNSLTREVYRSKNPIILTAKEFNLLEYFMLHPRQVLTRIQILDKIWGYDFAGDSNIIEVYVRYLRIKLEAHQEKRIIHTVRSVGYVLRSY